MTAAEFAFEDAVDGDLLPSSGAAKYTSRRKTCQDAVNWEIN